MENADLKFKAVETTSLALPKRGGGPQTIQGKQRSRYNALKHSIFAKVVLEDRESTAEFKKLSDGFLEHFQPEGRVELALVDRLVMLMWRQRRVVLAERGQVQSAYRFIEVNHYQNQIAEERQRRERLSLNDGLLEGCEDPWTLKEAISNLETLRQWLRDDGFDPEWDEHLLTRLYGREPLECLRQDFFGIYSDLAARAHKESENRSALVEETIKYLEAEISRLQYNVKYFERLSKRRTRCQSDAAWVPEQHAMDGLMRYEAHLSREFDRTLRQLERLQRMRTGQPVPLPIQVELSS